MKEVFLFIWVYFPMFIAVSIFLIIVFIITMWKSYQYEKIKDNSTNHTLNKMLLSYIYVLTASYATSIYIGIFLKVMVPNLEKMALGKIVLHLVSYTVFFSLLTWIMKKLTKSPSIKFTTFISFISMRLIARFNKKIRFANYFTIKTIVHNTIPIKRSFINSKYKHIICNVKEFIYKGDICIAYYNYEESYTRTLFLTYGYKGSKLFIKDIILIRNSEYAILNKKEKDDIREEIKHELYSYHKIKS